MAEIGGQVASNRTPLSEGPKTLKQGFYASHAEFAQKANDWSKSNFSRYCDPTYDDLFAQVKVELDPVARENLFKAMNDRLIDEGAVVPLVHLADISGRSTSLQGVQLTPWDVDLWNIGEWPRS